MIWEASNSSDSIAVENVDEKNQKIRTGREFKLKSRKTIQLDIELKLILLTRRYGEKGRTEPGTTDTILTNDTS